MFRSDVLFFVLLSPLVLGLSLVKLNESQKIGLPSFMYSHFNISDVNGVANVLQNFFNNVKDSISDYVDNFSGSEVQENIEVVDEEGNRTPDKSNTETVEVKPEKPIEVKEYVQNPPQQKPEKVEKVQQQVVDVAQQGKKPEEKVNPPQKVVQQQQTNVPVAQKVVRVQQNNQNNIQTENKPKQQDNKLPPSDVKAEQVNTNPPKDAKIVQQNAKPVTNTGNKANGEKPAADLKKPANIETNQKTDQKEQVQKVNVKQQQQQTKPQSNPGLFSEEAKQATIKLQSSLTNLDTSLAQHLNQLKTSNKVSHALNQLKAVAKSAEGSKCGVSKEEESLVMDVAKRAEEVLQTCSSSVPQTNKELLQARVSAALERVKDLDYNLRLTSDLCVAHKDPTSSICEEAKAKSLNSINDSVSQAVLQELGNLADNALLNAKKIAESCVEDGTKDLLKYLISLIKRINDCRADTQEL